jgi:iron-sulfur cluster repair protein YtfE (RIC family)
MIEPRDPVFPGAAVMAGKKVAPDAINLLMQDHRKVMFYFGAYDAADDADRRELERLIAINLLAHMALEEEIFYPAALGETGDEELVGESYDDHEEAKQLLRRLAEPSLGPEERLQIVRELKLAIQEHVETEETELFPKLREAGFDGVGVGKAMAARQPEAVAALTGKPLPFGEGAETEDTETGHVH